MMTFIENMSVKLPKKENERDYETSELPASEERDQEGACCSRHAHQGHC